MKWEKIIKLNKNTILTKTMRLCICLLFTVCYSLFIVQSCQAAWGKKPLPPLKPCEKISYVNIGWWDNFSDSCLKNYIIQAIAYNHDAREASWKVEEYKHAIKLQFAQELPSISVGADYIANHFQDVITVSKSNIFAVPFTASYEADIFLKNRDKTKSSKKTYEASQFQEKSIYISLASSVATTYLNLIKFDKQIEIQEKLVKIKQEELRREQARFHNGISSIPKLNEIKKSYEDTKNDLNELLKARDKTLNQLAVLTGNSPQNAAMLKRESWDNFEYKSQIPQEISSDVIFSRPDIMEKETQLEKANIDIRVARKEFLPKISVNGIYSFTNLGSTGFGSWNSTLAALLVGASLDLFKGGAKIANLKMKKAEYEQMFEAYQQTDLNALKEVNDSLLIIKQDSKTDENTAQKLLFQKDNDKRTLKSYKQGVISYPKVLEEQEQLLSLEKTKTDTKTVKLLDYITLYKAVGGKL